jgi:transcriptional regulator with XRE-family HTH domain
MLRGLTGDQSAFCSGTSKRSLANYSPGNQEVERMNDRIAKLASESGFDVSKDGKFGNYSTMFKLDKFAELIMAECISACATDRLGKTVSAEELIKQHFGVTDV